MRAQVLMNLLGIFLLASSLQSQECLECHKKSTPNIVSDWQLSEHSQNDVSCLVCHGEEHKSAQDIGKAEIPTPKTCSLCHKAQVAQFKKGKHAASWAAMKAMPTAHWQPMAFVEGMKGCGGCHKIGLKTEAEIRDLQKTGRGFGIASCDACHTRHIFSVQEARQPQACATCHMGFDHPQWEMYSTSKHGVRYTLKQNKTLPETASAPTCQTCHFEEGNHAVRTAWGFLAVRFPVPEDRQWAQDRVTVLQALGVLDLKGNPTPRLDVLKATDVARLTEEDWQNKRDQMIMACNKCHSLNFAKQELAKGDEMIKEADRLTAEAIRTLAELYKDGILVKPENYAYPFPDLFAFHDAPTVIEQKLFVMFFEHRMRTFQGIFHANPEYAFWYGWSALQQDLREIKMMAEELRKNSKRNPGNEE